MPKMKADNPDESIYCNECGNRIKQENTIVKEEHKKSTYEPSNKAFLSIFKSKIIKKKSRIRS